MSQTYADFRTDVLSRLTVDQNRYGVSRGGAKFADQHIRAALLDLQSHIPQLRTGHRNVFKNVDGTEEGDASIGELPDRAKTRDAYFVTKTCHCIRRPFVPYPWENRFDLFCGKPRIVGWQYFMTVDPFADKFIIYPKLTAMDEFWLYWDGVKGDYLDADVVRFGLEEAEAVGLFVKARICREVDKDLTMASSYWTSYAGGPGVLGIRTRLFSDWKQRGSPAPPATSPQAAVSNVCGCSSITCCWEGGSCGFFEGFLYLLGPDELYHKITIAVVGDPGSAQFVIGEGIAAPTWDACVTASAAGYMVSGGYFHILNTTTGEFVSITLSGSRVSRAIVFVPPQGELGSISTSAPGYRFDPCLKVLNTDTGEFCPLDLAEIT